MSDFTIFVLVIVAVVVSVLFWWYTRDYRSIPDDRVINLSTDEDRILNKWYAHYLQSSIDIGLNNSELAARCLERMYQITVDPRLLVVGMDLDAHYYRLTKEKLEVTDSIDLEQDQLFDLRRIIGKSGQIAIIQNDRLRQALLRRSNYDSNELKAIMDQELDLIARDYLREIFKYRWDKILALNDPHLLNHDGSYIYLRESNIPNIETFFQDGIHRLNLLCTDLEFETLIQRWTKSLQTVSAI